MFDWINKEVAEMTAADEIYKALCIITALVAIWAVGLAAEKLEEKWKERKNNEDSGGRFR